MGLFGWFGLTCFVKDIFEGIELKAGRPVSPWDKVRDSTGKSMRTGGEGGVRKDLGGIHLCLGGGGGLVSKSCLTLVTPWTTLCLPGSSVHRILQARILGKKEKSEVAHSCPTVCDPKQAL